MKLSDAKIRALRRVERTERLADGGGLYLRVLPSGVRTWRLDYRLKGGKLRTLTIGHYPDVSLAAAREQRAKAKALLAKGVDPITERERRAREQEADSRDAEDLFEKVVDRWLTSIEPGMSSVTHGRIKGRVANHVTPSFNGRRISSIGERELLSCLRQIQDSGAVYSAHRILNYVQRLFKFAKAEHLITINPAADIGDALARPPAVKHRNRLDFSDLPTFFGKLAASKAAIETKMAMELVVYCWCRTGEVRYATWSEIEDLDGKNPVWRLPAQRMKMRREHTIPLSPQAVEALKTMRQRTADKPYIFWAPTRSGVISNNRLLNLIEDLGFGGRATTHGFRGLSGSSISKRPEVLADLKAVCRSFPNRNIHAHQPMTCSGFISLGGLNLAGASTPSFFHGIVPKEDAK